MPKKTTTPADHRTEFPKKEETTYKQITLSEYLSQEYPDERWGSCGKCICRHCLYWWSSRCPYGDCYDDGRAVTDPYDKAHPEEPPRTSWSNWRTDQAYWCRGGMYYPIYECGQYVRYEGKEVKTCLESNVSVFQDGYILCRTINETGCKWCYERWERKQE